MEFRLNFEIDKLADVGGRHSGSALLAMKLLVASCGMHLELRKIFFKCK